MRRVRLHEATPFAAAPLPAFSLAAAQARGGVLPENIADSDEGGTLINYLGGPRTFSSDESNILEAIAINEADAEDFRDLTVFVGYSNYSSKDVFPTPYGDVPGVQIHAQAAATWVTPKGALKPVASAWTILIALFSSLLLLAPLARWPFWSTSISGVILVVAIVFGCMAGYAWGGMSIPMSVPLFAVALTYNGAALVELRRARTTLGRFIGQELVAQTLHPLSSLELGGRTEVATAFFCDLRGYSRLSETISPDRAANLLKAYTTTLTRVVESHGGRPIDYLGDGVFVLFEERHTKGAHALAATRAAVEAQRAFAALDQEWAGLVAPQGQPLEAAIAIHTGEMLIGLVGDEKHLKPGAVGDAVNVAAHAQSYSQQCGHRILATREAVAAITDTSGAGFAVHACGEFKFKGRQNLVELFGIESLEGRAAPVEAAENEA